MLLEILTDSKSFKYNNNKFNLTHTFKLPIYALKSII